MPATERSVLYEFQKLLTNVRYWVANGQSETAVKAIDEASADGWAATGWKEVCAREEALRQMTDPRKSVHIG